MANTPVFEFVPTDKLRVLSKCTFNDQAVMQRTYFEQQMTNDRLAEPAEKRRGDVFF